MTLVRTGFIMCVWVSAVYRYTVLSENQYLRFDRYTESNVPVSNKMLKLYLRS